MVYETNLLLLSKFGIFNLFGSPLLLNGLEKSMSSIVSKTCPPPETCAPDFKIPSYLSSSLSPLTGTFIEADSDFWSACMASLSTGGKVIVVSTPNGNDPIYYEIYDQALRGMNDFKITEMYWYRDPRYTKDLYFVKTDDAIHYLLNKEEYGPEKIVSWSEIEFEDRNFDIAKELISNGYKPCSDWFERMVKKLKYDKRKVSQELECNFLGSGDNVFDSKMLQTIRENMVKDPQNKMMGNSLWIWKEPIVGHKYIMGVDVSRGDSEDFSTIQIIDFDQYKVFSNNWLREAYRILKDDGRIALNIPYEINRPSTS